MAVNGTTLSGTVTPTDWAKAFLAALGYPVSSANVAAVVAWEAAEGGNWKNTAAYNPLNTTLVQPGSTAQNSVGVQAYTSWAQGLAATVETLQGNARGYSYIRTVLSSSGGCGALASALSEAAWGTNGGTVAKLCGVAYTPGSGSSASTSGNATSTSASSSCAWSIGPFCVFTGTQAEQVLGYAQIAAGGLIMVVAGALLGAAIISKTKVGQAARQSAQAVAGPAGAVGTVAAKPVQRASQARTESRQGRQATARYQRSQSDRAARANRDNQLRQTDAGSEARRSRGAIGDTPAERKRNQVRYKAVFAD